MPGSGTNGPVTRRQSKRKSVAVITEAAEPAESVAKRVKTEAATQEQSQTNGVSGGANTLGVTIDSNNVENNDEESPEQEPDSIPARPPTTGELLNEYLLGRMRLTTGVSQQFNQQFSDEAMSRFGWVKEGEVVDWPSGGTPVMFSEWEESYALKRDIEVFKGYSRFQAKEARDALQAIRALEQCKRAKDRVISDEAFIKKWQLKWQREVLAQSELMFNQILKPLERHKRTLEVTGQNLSNEITGYARRQTM